MEAKEAEFLKWDMAILSHHIQTKQISPVEVIESLIQRIQKLNPSLNAFITILYDEALQQAKKAEQEISLGKTKGALHGIPLGLKDLIYTAGIRTTMGSEIYQNYIPEANAAVVEKLKLSGAILIGKLNTHEFAYGPTGDVSFFGAVRNPYDQSRMTGGSSSGAGAAVATGLCYGAIGTDTGGSIRIPSSACGIVGMKPTFGRVSKFGVFPLGYTLDHVGPMTRTVGDNAMLLNYLAAYDARDPYSVKGDPEDFTRRLEEGVKGAVIGIPTTYYFEKIDPEIKNQIDQAVVVLSRLGAEIVEVEMDLSQAAWAQLMTIRSEAYAVHEKHMDQEPNLLHPDVKDRLAASKETTGYEYVNAQEIRRQIVQQFKDAFAKVDALIAPTLAILPPEIGQREVIIQGENEHVYSALLRLNGPANLTGLPSMSLPCGFSEGGLPIGLQLIGNHFDEANLYRIGQALENELQLPTLKWDIQ